MGDEWWRHYHGDAAYEAETVRLFEVEYRPGIAKLLTAADQRGYQPAGPDLAYLADVAGTEDIWVLLLRCRLSARGLTGDPVGVVERLGELQGLGEGLRDALPLGRPPARLVAQSRSLRLRIYYALRWSPRTPLYARTFDAAFPDRAGLSAEEVPGYIEQLLGEIQRLQAELSDDLVPRERLSAQRY